MARRQETSSRDLQKGSARQKASLLQKALDLLSQLGFAPLKKGAKQQAQEALPEKQLLAPAQDAAQKGHPVAKVFVAHAPELVRLAGNPLPRLVYTLTPTGGRKNPTLLLGAHIAGPRHPYTEAFAMFVAHELTSLLQPKTPLCVHYNTLGDHESIQAYLKDAHGALRRTISALSPSLQAVMREEGAAGVWRLSLPRHPVLFDFPRPLEYLTPPSREAFQEALDLLEGNELPYEIDDLLIYPPSVFSHSIFVVRQANGEDDEPPLAFGATVSELLRAAYPETSAALVSVVVPVPEATLPTDLPTPPARVKFLYAPIGKEARALSFQVIRTLQSARVAFEANVACGNFCNALAAAERRRIPYVVIMGIPEAHRRVAVVRRLEDRSQREVPLANLKTFLSRIDKAWKE